MSDNVTRMRTSNSATKERYTMLWDKLNTRLLELTPGGIAVYVFLTERYDRYNNGEIKCSYEDLRKRWGWTDKTAGKHLQEVERKGFIKRTNRGTFSRGASTWRLMDYP